MRLLAVMLLILVVAGMAAAQAPAPGAPPAAPQMTCPNCGTTIACPMMQGMGGMGMMPHMMARFVVPLVSLLSPAAVAQAPERIYVVKGDRLIAYDRSLNEVASATLPALQLPAFPGPEPLVPPAGSPAAPRTPVPGMGLEALHGFIAGLVQAVAPAVLSVTDNTVVVVRGNQVLTYNTRLEPQKQVALPMPTLPTPPPMPGPGAGAGPMRPMAGPPAGVRPGPGLHNQPVQQIADATTRIELSPDPPVVGDNTLTLSITDLVGQPVTANVTWSLTRVGNAKVVASGEARPAGAGEYRNAVRLPDAGPWQVAYRIRRKGQADQFAYYRFLAAAP